MRSLQVLSTPETWCRSGITLHTASRLEGGARRAISWGRDNGVCFETAKTEAILFSRNRRHWKDRVHSHIMVDSRPIPFNRQATRWLGIYYLVSRLRFAEHTMRGANRAKAAGRRLRSILSRHRVPPLSARHIREAIVSSTLMYGPEATWRGQ